MLDECPGLAIQVRGGTWVEAVNTHLGPSSGHFLLEYLRARRVTYRPWKGLPALDERLGLRIESKREEWVETVTHLGLLVALFFAHSCGMCLWTTIMWRHVLRTQGRPLTIVRP